MTITDNEYDTIEELATRINYARAIDLYTLKIDEFNAVLRGKKKYIKQFRHFLETQGDDLPVITLKENGLNKFSAYFNIQKCPFACILGSKGMVDDALLEAEQGWAKFISNISSNKVKMISFDPTWHFDRVVDGNSVAAGRKGPVHTEEWNRNIGLARRGLRLKTKPREGIEWRWEGNKKVWIIEPYNKI